MQATKVTYLPAYLRQVIQSHFKIHGDEIYDDAKSLRHALDNVLMVASHARQATPDPVRDLANAAALMKAANAKKRLTKPAVAARQADLFLNL